MQNALIKTTPQSLQKLNKALAITEKLLEDDNPLGLPELIPYRKGNKWGFCNRKKEIVIACEYDSVELFAEGLAIVGRKQKYILKYGFIDKRGNEVIPLIYDGVYSFSEGLARVNIGSYRYGFINKNGDVIIPFVYDDDLHPTEKDWKKYHYFSDGLARVSMKGQDGIIDKSGNIVVPFIYDYIGPFKEGLALVVKDQKRGFIDKLGNVIIPLIYQSYKYYDYDDFSEGLVCVTKESRSGFINKNGNVIIPFQYVDVKSFSESLAVAVICSRSSPRTEFKYGFIDKTGKVIIPFIYDWAFSFSEGLAKVRKDNYWGFIDKNGNTVIPFKYTGWTDSEELSTCFSGGLARVETFLKLKPHYIDKLGNVIIPDIYENLHDFNGSLAKVSKGKNNRVFNGYFFIDKKGTEYYED